ncbi:uncharacterized protein LOC124365188 isoform X1 [Homalodisca vitripennis]|uniref:uncharacterized protein LOC124365188 isoform X1 n=2 Tax=Homalodisca vitripennis TaxID=197043 RepID=UPI001EEC66EB|nr:uncharacterized protein LOC124365188 isoform X1 [Homalodisca vitripennis]
MKEITDKNLNEIPEDASQGNIPNPDTFQNNGNRDTTYAKTMLKELLRFDVHHRTEKDLQEHVSRLRCLVRKVVLLLLEKSSLRKNLEEQRTVLTLQCTSLKNLVAVTKDLLTLRNTEVEQLYKNIKIMEERINLENIKQQNILNTLSESARLNEDIKAQYHCQIEMFNDLRARYKEKVALLAAENTQLSGLLVEQNINMVGDGREGRHCDSPEETRESKELSDVSGQGEPNEIFTDLIKHTCERKSLCEILTNKEENIAPKVPSIDMQSKSCPDDITDKVTEKQKGYGEGEVQGGVIMKLEGDNEEKIATSGPEIIQSQELTENVMDKEIAEHTGQGEGETSCLTPDI